MFTWHHMWYNGWSVVTRKWAGEVKSWDSFPLWGALPLQWPLQPFWGKLLFVHKPNIIWNWHKEHSLITTPPRLVHLLWNDSETGGWRCPELLGTQSVGPDTHSLLWHLVPALGTVKLSFPGWHPFSHVIWPIFLVLFSTVVSEIRIFYSPHRPMSSFGCIPILKSIRSWDIYFGFNSLSLRRAVLTTKRPLGLSLLPLILPASLFSWAPSYMSFWKPCTDGDCHLLGSSKAFNTFIVSYLCIMGTLLSISRPLFLR